MGQTIGILGAGQLGRMIALAGYPLGLRFRFFDPEPQSPANHLAEHVACPYEDTQALQSFANSVDVLTYEFENVPVSAVRMLQEIKPIYPPPSALEVSQDRLAEKLFLRSCGIPTANFLPIDSGDDAVAACDVTGLPAVLKTRRMGYDGKGQRIVNTPAELTVACEELGRSGLILEQFIPFTSECSLIAVRSVAGETRYYPMIENLHRGGILRRSTVPCIRITPAVEREAQDHAGALMTALNYVGVLAIEYFVVDGALIANEIAPRVHNSGHLTIEGAETSQFENHLRAILDLPLGSTHSLGHIGMLNIIGDLPPVPEILSVAGAHLHLYGKAPRPNRKIGHVTVRAKSASDLESALERLSFVR